MILRPSGYRPGSGHSIEEAYRKKCAAQEKQELLDQAKHAGAIYTIPFKKRPGWIAPVVKRDRKSIFNYGRTGSRNSSRPSLVKI